MHVADKQNVMATSRLWRDVATRVAKDYPDVQFQPILADALAMHLLYRPTQFDVVVADNLFGDILTDEAAVLAGSMGLMPSASFGEARNRHGGRRGLYEPIHGSAPDIAGQGKADPTAAVLSVAMLLDHVGRRDEAKAVEAAVAADLAARVGQPARSTSEIGDAIAARVAG